MRIAVDADKCTACRICELVCSHTKLQTFNSKSACIKICNLDYWGFSNPVLCKQCKDPVCVEVCSMQALSQTEAGTILVAQGKCNGCGTCADVCPFEAIKWHDERGLLMICDLCGGKPVCVEWCPTGALTFSNTYVKASKGKGKRELRYSVRIGKRYLNKLNIPSDVLNWYEKFI